MSQHDPYAGAPSYPTDPQQHGSGKKGLSIAALVVGILALPAILTVVGGIVLGLIALVLGIIAARGASRGRNAGRGMAITGAVLGVVGIVVSGIILAIGVSFLNSDTGQDLRDCISQAGDDQAAVDQCSRDLEDDLGGS